MGQMCVAPLLAPAPKKKTISSSMIVFYLLWPRSIQDCPHGWGRPPRRSGKPSTTSPSRMPNWNEASSRREFGLAWTGPDARGSGSGVPAIHRTRSFWANGRLSYPPSTPDRSAGRRPHGGWASDAPPLGGSWRVSKMGVLRSLRKAVLCAGPASENHLSVRISFGHPPGGKEAPTANPSNG